MAVSQEMQDEFNKLVDLAPSGCSLTEKINHALNQFARNIKSDHEWNYYKRIPDEPIVSDI